MKVDESVYVDTILDLLRSDISIAEDIHPNLLNDKDFVLVMLNRYPLALAYIPDKFTDDLDIILPAITRNGLALEYVSDKLKSDRQIVATAVNNIGRAIQFADQSLRFDPEFMLMAVTNDGTSLKYANEELKNNKDIVLATVQQRGSMLKYVSPNLKNDRDVVYAAIHDDKPNLKYADRTILFNDLDLVLTSLYYNVENYKFLPGEIRSLPEVHFMCHEICNAGYELEFNTWLIVKRALLEHSDRFLNPPAIIKELSEGLPNKYVILAQYALNTYAEDPCELPPL